jgi:hypothetical protein
VVTSSSEATIRKGVKANESFGDWGGALTLRALGGKAPLKWELLDRNNQVMALPEGMRLNPGEADASRLKLASVRLEGGLKEVPNNFFFRVRVTDAEGKTDERDYVVNTPDDVKDANDKEKPAPPREVKVVANTNSATLSWQPSPSPDVVGYRVYRSEATKDKQEERVYFEGNGPALEKDDYIFFNRILTEIEPCYTNARVGFEPGLTGFFGTTWSASNGVQQEIAPHDPALTTTFKDGGKSALKLVSGVGEQSIMQNVFTGANGDANNWYTQLEPGKNYRMEVWMRGENLSNDGKVVFDYNNNVPGYADLSKTFSVTKDWQKFTYDFVGPARPDKAGIFGHRFRWTGVAAANAGARSTLWLDNARIFRYDSTRRPHQSLRAQPDRRERDDRQPAQGRQRQLARLRAADEPGDDGFSAELPAELQLQRRLEHSDRLLHRDDAADGARRVHAHRHNAADARASLPDAAGLLHREGVAELHRVSGRALRPQDRHAQDQALRPPPHAASRRSPHAVDRRVPAHHRGIRQRNLAQRHLRGWEGFSRSYVSWAPDEGREMGHFSRYFFQAMVDSPYWKSQKLGDKISFNLGGFYNGNVEADGRITGYAENARKHNPLMSQIGHATYVGPKWETGDAPLKTFNDAGVLATLVSYIADSKEMWTQQSNAMKKMTELGMPYDLTAYEGGPSGYFLPGQGDPDAG